MPRYLIEVPHDPDLKACLREMQGFMQAGAHFLTNADWGCIAGDHRALIIIEAPDDAFAQLAVPPVVRHKAKVVRLTRFTPEYIRTMQNIDTIFVGGQRPAHIPLDEYFSLVGQMFLDLSGRLGVQPTEIKLAKVERATWPDTSLGRREPGRTYAAAITPGFRMELVAGGKAYWYHTSTQRAVFAGETPTPTAP